MILLFFDQCYNDNIMIILGISYISTQWWCRINIQLRISFLYDSHFVLFILVPNMSSSGNPLSWIKSIEPLTGANYPQWREKVNMGLAVWDW
jgi:hypothetical protein